MKAELATMMMQENIESVGERFRGKAVKGEPQSQPLAYFIHRGILFS